MQRPELLAPAGNMEKLRTAVHYGADAVYLGGRAFGLRNLADNFSISEMAAALDFCHERGVRVYLTVNSYPHNDALERLVHQPRIRLFLEGVTAGVVGLIAGTTLALLRVSLTGLEALILFAIVLGVLFASKARLLIPAVIAGAALWGWVSQALGQ